MAYEAVQQRPSVLVLEPLELQLATSNHTARPPAGVQLESTRPLLAVVAVLALAFIVL